MANEKKAGSLVSEVVEEHLVAGVGSVNLNPEMITSAIVKAEEEDELKLHEEKSKQSKTPTFKSKKKKALDPMEHPLSMRMTMLRMKELRAMSFRNRKQQNLGSDSSDSE